MHLTQLTLAHLDPWAELLAVSFARSPVQMHQLLTYLNQDDRLLAWGAWNGRQLIAQYSCLRHELLLPNCAGPVRVGMSINMAVHPDFRGQGLVKQVSQPVYAGLRDENALAGVGFSNADGVKVDRHSKGYGYRVLGKMRSVAAWIKPVRGAEPLRLTDVWPERPFAPTSPKNAVTFHNKPAWLRSRFAQHPFRRYQYAVWETDGVVQGLIIFRPFRRRFLSGVSLLSAYGENLDQLFAGFAAALHQRGVRLIHMLETPQAEYQRTLAKTAVCFPLPITRTPYYLTLKPLIDPLPAALQDFAMWSCSGGDIL